MYKLSVFIHLGCLSLLPPSLFRTFVHSFNSHLQFSFPFAGYRCFKAVLFLTGLMFGSVIIFLLCYKERILDTQLSIEASVGIGLGIGTLCGLVTMLVRSVGLFMVGLLLGLLVGIGTLIGMEELSSNPRGQCGCPWACCWGWACCSPSSPCSGRDASPRSPQPCSGLQWSSWPLIISWSSLDLWGIFTIGWKRAPGSRCAGLRGWSWEPGLLSPCWVFWCSGEWRQRATPTRRVSQGETECCLEYVTLCSCRFTVPERERGFVWMCVQHGRWFLSVGVLSGPCE